MHTTEIVPVERVGNLLADVERLYDAIAAKANQYSDDRGSVEGYMDLLEIAAATGLTEGSVKVHLFRALSSIRKQIGSFK